jgi:hypothetical protein
MVEIRSDPPVSGFELVAPPLDESPPAEVVVEEPPPGSVEFDPHAGSASHAAASANLVVMATLHPTPL